MLLSHYGLRHLLYFYASSQVEGLMDDIDFKAKVTRSEFEALCADLFERVSVPVQEALTAAEMQLVSSPSAPTAPLSASSSRLFLFSGKKYTFLKFIL